MKGRLKIGNTYTLLETERLLREKETAEGKPKDDAVTNQTE